MKTLKFKSNIKCSGCIEKVGPVLNDIVGENNWQVDLQVSDRTLTLTAEDVNVDDLIDAIKKVGYTLEKL